MVQDEPNLARSIEITLHFFFQPSATAVAILFGNVLHFVTNLQLIKASVRPSTVGLIRVLDEQIERFRLGLWPCQELGSHRHAFDCLLLASTTASDLSYKNKLIYEKKVGDGWIQTRDSAVSIRYVADVPLKLKEM